MAQTQWQCNGCPKIIGAWWDGQRMNDWVTFNKEGEDRFVAYSFECDHKDPKAFDHRNREI